MGRQGSKRAVLRHLIDFIEQTGSTNSDLAARLGAGDRVPEGYWLVANRQSAGRGRQGREWFDGSGNFMGSTPVHRAPGDPAMATLALVAGLAIYETCLNLLADPSRLSLKWPNDLMIGSAKAAGILLEGLQDSVIIGIGANLAAAPQIEGRETIAFSALGPAPERDGFAERLAAQFAMDLGRWRTFGLDPILARWQAAAHAAGTSLTVHDPDGSLIKGSFDGLSSDGSMRLRLADGTTRAIHAGDVMLG